jgi:hypothetical protein
MTELKKKAGSVLSSKIADGILTIAVTGHPPIIFDPAYVAPAHHITAELYGWKQRLSDAAAIARDTTTGMSATTAEKYAAIRRLADHYLNGAVDWNMKTGSAGPRGPQWDAIVIAAICEAYGKTDDVVKAMAVAKCGDTAPVAYLAAIAATAKVAPIVARMRLATVVLDDSDPFAADEAEEAEEEDGEEEDNS